MSENIILVDKFRCKSCLEIVGASKLQDIVDANKQCDHCNGIGTMPKWKQKKITEVKLGLYDLTTGKRIVVSTPEVETTEKGYVHKGRDGRPTNGRKRITQYSDLRREKKKKKLQLTCKECNTKGGVGLFTKNWAGYKCDCGSRNIAEKRI